MSKSESLSTQPKSIRQKRILDIAADNPGATLADIAEQIPSVSADHVDRVLDQYGDPASGDSGTDQSPPETSDADANDDATPAPHDSPEGRPPAAATARTEAPSAGADAESDGPSATDTPESDGQSATDTPESDGQSATDTPVTTSDMEPDTDPDPTDSVVEPDPDSEPSDDPTEAAGSDAADASSTDEIPDPGDLTQKERETLRAISYQPTATQDQIADMLSISRATVSNRVNAIPGFDWAERGSFVEAVFDEDVTVDASAGPTDDGSAVAQNAGKEAVTDGASGALSEQTGGGSPLQGATADSGVDGSASTVSAPQAADQDVTTDGKAASGDDLAAISDRLETFAQQLEAIEREVHGPDTASEGSPLSDTGLLHKVVHACMDSDRITEEEELQILDALTD